MIPNGAENVFLSIVQAVTEVLNKSHFSLQMGNCPIPVAEHSGLSASKHLDTTPIFLTKNVVASGLSRLQMEIQSYLSLVLYS